MFVGHYGIALAARGCERRIPLWAYFLAVQWVDILWCVLVYLGVERVHVQPGLNPSSPLVFDYYPYTHSLLAALLWAAAAYGAYRLLARGAGSHAAALMLAVAVLSHWPLDLLVHLPDLPLVSGPHKVGLGLWNHPLAECAVELLLLIAGLALYFRRSPHLSRARRVALVALCAGIAAVQLAGSFGPPPPSVKVMALSGLVLYLVFAALAGAIEGRGGHSRSVPQAPGA